MTCKQTTLAEARIGDFIEFKGVEGQLINKRVTSSCASRGNRYELEVSKELKERTVTGYDTDSVTIDCSRGRKWAYYELAGIAKNLVSPSLYLDVVHDSETLDKCRFSSRALQHALFLLPTTRITFIEAEYLTPCEPDNGALYWVHSVNSVGSTAEFCIKQFSAEETEEFKAQLSLFSADNS